MSLIHIAGDTSELPARATALVHVLGKQMQRGLLPPNYSLTLSSENFIITLKLVGPMVIAVARKGLDAGPAKRGHQAVWDHDNNCMWVYGGIEQENTHAAIYAYSTASNIAGLAVSELYTVISPTPPRSSTMLTTTDRYTVAAGQRLGDPYTLTITTSTSSILDSFNNIPYGSASYEDTREKTGAWEDYGPFDQTQAVWTGLEAQDDGFGIYYVATSGYLTLSYPATYVYAATGLTYSGASIYPNLPGGPGDLFTVKEGAADMWGDYYNQDTAWWYDEYGTLVKRHRGFSTSRVYGTDWINHADAYHLQGDALTGTTYDAALSNALWSWSEADGWVQQSDISYADWLSLYREPYRGSILDTPHTSKPIHNATPIADRGPGDTVTGATYVRTPGGTRYAYGGTYYGSTRYIGASHAPALGTFVKY